MKVSRKCCQPSSRPAGNRIGLIPQDNRPVSSRQVKDLLKGAGHVIFTPPEPFLGGRDKPGRPRALFRWLLTHAAMVEGWIISLDMLVYGGLLFSRDPGQDQAEYLERLSLLEQLRSTSPFAPIIAFQSIRRASTTVRSSADIAEWRANQDGNNPGIHRGLNHQVNLAALELTSRGIIDRLLLLQEDTSMACARTRGEQNDLSRRSTALGIDENVVITTGTDEGAMTAAASLVWRLDGRRALVKVFYSCDKGADKISLYEDRTIRESVKGQLRACGAVETNDAQKADVMLFVWCPEYSGRADLFLDGAGKITRDMRAEKECDDFISEIRHAVAKQAGPPAVIADTAFANGADDMLAGRLREIPLARLAGYAALNTTSNAVGCALAQGLLPRITGNFLSMRIIEDWGYQSVLRPGLSEWLQKQRNADIWRIDFDNRQRAQARLTGEINKWIKEKTSISGMAPVFARLPWSRAFEALFQDSAYWNKGFIPVEADCDVLVCGGGTSGCCAAIAASRNGARTILVEEGSALGGTAVYGLVAPWMPFHARAEKQIVAGIGQEIVDRLKDAGGTRGHVSDPIGCAASLTPLDPHILRMVICSMLDEAGVTVLLRSKVCAVLRKEDNGRHLVQLDCYGQPLVSAEPVSGVVISHKAGRSAISAGVVVDASGDGDAAYYAGCEYEYGRSSDHQAQPLSLIFHLRSVDCKAVRRAIKENPQDFVITRRALESIDTVEYLAVAGFFSIIEKAVEDGALDGFRDRVLFFELSGESRVLVNMTRVTGLSTLDVFEASAAEREALGQVGQCISFLRNYIPGFEHAELEQIAPRTAARESRHIAGLYTLTARDVLEGKDFPDGVALGSFPIDIHSPDGGSVELLRMKPGTWYSIPYGCLIPRGIENLIVTGRAISATHEANASARLSPTCLALGQAAGTAAALSVCRDQPPSRLNPALLRDKLKEQGCLL